MVFCDAPGQEKYRSMNLLFSKNSDIVIFVYEIANKNSFIQLKEFWVQSIIKKIGNDIIFGLAATKSDLFQREELSIEEGIEYAKEIGATFRLTSAKNEEEGIILFINELIEKVLYKKKLIQSGEKILFQITKKENLNRFCTLYKYLNI